MTLGARLGDHPIWKITNRHPSNLPGQRFFAGRISATSYENHRSHRICLSRISSLAAISSATFLASLAYSQTVIPWNGVVNNAAAENWGTALNWTGANIPDSSTEQADFRKDWTGTVPTLTLNADYAINGILFADTGASADIALSINAGNTITLAGTAPLLQIDGSTLTLNGPLAGSTAWAKTGAGILNLLDNNASLTGATTIKGSAFASTGGTVNLGSATVATEAIAGSSAVTVGNSAVLTLINTTGNLDRIGNTVPVNLTLGGALTLTHNAAVNTTETIGALNLIACSGTVSVSSAASRVTTLAAPSFNRGTAFATALVRGTSLSQAVGTNSHRTLGGHG